MLEETQVARKDPGLRHNCVLSSELSGLGRNVSVHEVFASDLPGACKVVTVFETIKIFELLSFERRGPENVPRGALSLAEASPGERVNDTVVGVHIARDFELQFEQIFLHLKHRGLKWLLTLLPALGWIHKVHNGLSMLKRGILQKYWS